MVFSFEYTLIYKNGERFMCGNITPSVQLSRAQYLRLAKALMEKPELDDRAEIADILSIMKETVLIRNRWMNKNGTIRSTPLKKPREIVNISLIPCQNEMLKITKYPLEVLSQPEESITLRGSDGIEIKIHTGLGEVRVQKGTVTSVFDTDYFIRRLIW